jgi:hypothetical protein
MKLDANDSDESDIASGNITLYLEPVSAVKTPVRTPVRSPLRSPKIMRFDDDSKKLMTVKDMTKIMPVVAKIVKSREVESLEWGSASCSEMGKTVGKYWKRETGSSLDTDRKMALSEFLEREGKL